MLGYLQKQSVSGMDWFLSRLWVSTRRSSRPIRPTSGFSHSRKLFFSDSDFTLGQRKISVGSAPAPRSRMLSRQNSNEDELVVSGKLVAVPSFKESVPGTGICFIIFKSKMRYSKFSLLVNLISFSDPDPKYYVGSEPISVIRIQLRL